MRYSAALSLRNSTKLMRAAAPNASGNAKAATMNQKVAVSDCSLLMLGILLSADGGLSCNSQW